MAEIVVILGKEFRGLERLSEFEAATGDFDWKLVFAEGVEDLRRLNRTDHIVAVAFRPDALESDWRHALKTIQEWTPLAQPLLCLPASASNARNDFMEQGVFHTLLTPFKRSEARQSLGFVWSAKHQRATQKALEPAEESPA